MGFFHGWDLDYQKVLDPSEMVSGTLQGLGVEMVFSGKPQQVGGDTKILEGMVKEFWGIQAGFGFVILGLV